MNLNETRSMANGKTKLMRAVATENLTALFDILNNNENEDAQLFAKDDKGRTALDWARLCNNELAIAVLLKAMEKVIKETRATIIESSSVEIHLRTTNASQMVQVKDALNKCDCETIYEVLHSNTLFRDVIEASNQTYFIDVLSDNGDNAIILAARNNHLKLLDLALEVGLDINHMSKYGHTALTWACICGNTDIVRKLLVKGANPFQESPEGRTALHYACLHSKVTIIGILFEVIFAKFGTYRDNVPIGKVNPTKWSSYASFLEDYIKVNYIYILKYILYKYYLFIEKR
jgi:ankyrin repeat protein